MADIEALLKKHYNCRCQCIAVHKQVREWMWWPE